MKCGNCSAYVVDGADECPQCGYVLLARDRKLQGQHADGAYEREQAQKLFCADHERKRYQLEPRREDESIKDFDARINRQKTPYVLAEHKKLLDRLNANPTNNLKLPAVPREPGDDDEPPEVQGEQAA